MKVPPLGQPLVAAAVGLGLLVATWSSPNLRAVVSRLDSLLVSILYLTVIVMVGATVIGRRAGRSSWSLPRWALSSPLQGAARALPGVATPAGLVGSMLAFSAPLFAAWHDGKAWATVGGAVPFADAHLYFGGAERLLFFGDLDIYNSRRPLNAMFLAIRLAVTNLDLRLALLLGALVVGAATFVAVRAVARDLGPVGGLAVFAGIFSYTRVYVPTTMTETLGVTFAALALAALWTAVRDRNRWLSVAGVALVTMALDARSGVFLLPVLLAVWLARHLHGKGLLDWRFLSAAVASIVVGFGFNYTAVAALGGDTGNLFGNGGFVVYGMAKGYPSWSYPADSWNVIYKDHPEIVEMSDTERNRFVNDLAQEEMRADPLRFAGAALRSEKNYLAMAKRQALDAFPVGWHPPLMAAGALAIALTLGWRAHRARAARQSGEHSRASLRGRALAVELATDLAMFGTMLVAVPVLVSKVPGNSPPEWLAPALVLLAFAAFLGVGTRRLGLPAHVHLTLTAFAAAVLCLPMLGADTVRVFAAAAPFMALPLILAVGVLVRTPAPPDTGPDPEPDHQPARRRREGAVPVLAGVALLAVLVVATPIAMAAVSAPRIEARRCPDGSPAAPLIGGVGVRVVEPPSTGRDIDQIELDAFLRKPTSNGPAMTNHILSVTGPATFVGALTETGDDRFAIVEADVDAPESSVLYLCGQVQHDPLADFAFRYFPQPLDVFRGRPLGGG